MNELSSLRTETTKTFELDPKLGQGQYAIEARTGPIHYKETYAAHEPWLDLHETCFEESDRKDVGKVFVYSKLPNSVTIFRDRCGYEIRSRCNPEHLARVELVAIDGQEVSKWVDDEVLRLYPKVHSRRVGIWKEFKAEKRATLKWRITEQGAPGRFHPFIFREEPEAFTQISRQGITDLSLIRVAISCTKTRVDDRSFFWEEIIPKEAMLVDTDFQVAAGGDDGYWYPTTGNTTHWYPNDTLMGCYSPGNPQAHMWARWTNLTIPAGSTINTCTTSWYGYGNFSTNMDDRLYFVAENSAAQPSSYNDLNGRSLTSNYTTWHPSQWNFGWYTSPSMVNPFQEIVNRAGWASGNAAMLFFTYYSGTGINMAYTYNYGSSYAPKLSATWTEPASKRGPSIYVPNVSWLSKALAKRREI